MELTKRQRNLISRGTALCVGAALAYGCVAMTTASRPTSEQLAATHAEGRPASGGGGLVIVLLGLPALAFLGFALVPSRWLYKIDPSPSRADGSDVVAGGLHSLLP
jgi:hypothetical protein